MDALDRLVIVEIGNGQGIQMLESDAKAQGLRYVVEGKEYVPAALDNKMVGPAENKSVPVRTEKRKVK